MKPALNPATRAQLAATLSQATAAAFGGQNRPWLIVDADRTLAHADTGRLVGTALATDARIRQVFETHGYIEHAFAEVSEVWSGVDAPTYQEVVHTVATTVAIHPEWLAVFAVARGACPVAVVTAGIPQAWRLILDRHGLQHIPIVGGCHAELDDYFVSATTKAEAVQLVASWGWHVVAAGDSLLDLPMLQAADVPLFVPDHKGSPALNAQLHTVPNVRHFAIQNSRDVGLPKWTAQTLIDHLLQKDADHAHRPNQRTALLPASQNRRETAKRATSAARPA